MKIKLSSSEMLAQWKLRRGFEPLRADCVISRADGIDLDIAAVYIHIVIIQNAALAGDRQAAVAVDHALLAVQPAAREFVHRHVSLPDFHAAQTHFRQQLHLRGHFTGMTWTASRFSAVADSSTAAGIPSMNGRNFR